MHTDLKLPWEVLRVGSPTWYKANLHEHFENLGKKAVAPFILKMELYQSIDLIDESGIVPRSMKHLMKNSGVPVDDIDKILLGSNGMYVTSVKDEMEQKEWLQLYVEWWAMSDNEFYGRNSNVG